ELLFIEQRAVTLDVASFLQRADPAQAGRRGNTNAACQLHIGDAAVRLQLFEDFAVDRVEAGWHRRSFFGRTEMRKFIARNIISRNNIARSYDRDRRFAAVCGCDGLRILHSSAESHTSSKAKEPKSPAAQGDKRPKKRPSRGAYNMSKTIHAKVVIIGSGP